MSDYAPASLPNPTIQSVNQWFSGPENREYLRSYLIGRLRPQDIADVAGEIYIKAVRSSGTYREEMGELRKWITQVARSCVQDHYKNRFRRKRSQQMTVGIAEVRGRDLSAFAYDGLSDAVAYEVGVQRFLDALAPQLSMALSLRLGGQDNREIASAMVLAPGTVRHMLFDIRRKLKRIQTGELELLVKN